MEFSGSLTSLKQICLKDIKNCVLFFVQKDQPNLRTLTMDWNPLWESILFSNHQDMQCFSSIRFWTPYHRMNILWISLDWVAVVYSIRRHFCYHLTDTFSHEKVFTFDVQMHKKGNYWIENSKDIMSQCNTNDEFVK